MSGFSISVTVASCTLNATLRSSRPDAVGIADMLHVDCYMASAGSAFGGSIRIPLGAALQFVPHLYRLLGGER